jgi:hypothetical protein
MAQFFIERDSEGLESAAIRGFCGEELFAGVSFQRFEGAERMQRFGSFIP